MSEADRGARAGRTSKPGRVSPPSIAAVAFGALGAVAVAGAALGQGTASPAVSSPPSAGSAASSPGGDGLLARLSPAVPGGLTADEAATRAAATSLDARAREQAVRGAEARIDQAQVGYYPRLSLTASYTRLSPLDPFVFGGGGGTTGGMTTGGTTTGGMAGGAAATLNFPVDNYVGQANLTVPISDYVLRTSQNVRAATGSHRAAQLDEQATRLLAAANARIAYYGWLRAKAQVVVTERTLEQSRSHHVDAQHRFEAGTASRADVLKAQAQVANDSLNLEHAKNAASYGEDQLRVTMHDESGKGYGIGEDLRQDVPPLEDAADPRKLLLDALDRRPDVRSLDSTVLSLREQAKVTRASQYPRLDAFGDVIYANPNSRIFPQRAQFDATWDLGLRLTWSPNDTLANAGAGRQIDAQVAQTEAQKAALLDAVRLEIIQALQAVKEATVAVRTTNEVLSASEEAYRVSSELFKNGRSTYIDLSDAETRLFQASLEIVNAQADLRIARARLVHASGHDVPAAQAANGSPQK